MEVIEPLMCHHQTVNRFINLNLPYLLRQVGLTVNEVYQFTTVPRLLLVSVRSESSVPIPKAVSGLIVQEGPDLRPQNTNIVGDNRRPVSINIEAEKASRERLGPTIVEIVKERSNLVDPGVIDPVTADIRQQSTSLSSDLVVR
ncbi:hypothetical protein AD006_06105 [Pseudonocardia sp. EC080610-09]|nr:hypothetical protein FRP1_26920 [Pseudonocardia sp. EC080625-04]ALL74988.1 hypothetical protein AD006_06105 [Pseudonocardia sp. EC080610-09]ALL82010.1 hypothetical protein AD017_13925 [Pseudonocardia sp. EC080619-01]